MPEAEIREASSDADYAAARTLILEYAEWLDVDLDFQDFDDEIGDLPSLYGRPAGRLFLAYCDDIPAACAGLRRLPASGEAEMKRLFVRPEFRGRGLARRLVRRVISVARDLGYRTLRLDTWPPRMAQADAMYRRFGFVSTPPYYHNPYPGVIFYELPLQGGEGAQESGGGGTA